MKKSMTMLAVENVYNEMEYAEPARIIVKTSRWSRKRIIILVAFLLVLFGGRHNVCCYFSNGVSFKFGGGQGY